MDCSLTAGPGTERRRRLADYAHKLLPHLLIQQLNLHARPCPVMTFHRNRPSGPRSPSREQAQPTPGQRLTALIVSSSIGAQVDNREGAASYRSAVLPGL